MSRIMSPRRIEAMMWILLFSGLATGIGFETDWGRRLVWPIELPDSQSTPFAKPTLAESFSMPAADTFLEISMRPLFVFTRRPAPAIPVDATTPIMKKDQFVLTGTTLVTEGKFAHLLEKAVSKSHVVAEGKEINGILVKEVRLGSVVLAQGDETEVIVLRTAKAPPVAAGAPSGASKPSANAAPGIPPPPSAQ